MIKLRQPKGRGGIGGGGYKNAKKPIKQVSPKQRKRTNQLQDKLEEILKVQKVIYGKHICEAIHGHPNWKHKCPSLDGRIYKLFADHVETRNEQEADKYENLQVLCSWCNYQKGSVRGLDFRTPGMIAAMKAKDLVELDRKG